MYRLHYVGLAMLVFVMTLWLTPAAMAWQNGRSTRGIGGTTVQQWILRQAVARAGASGSDWVDLDAALKTVGLPDTHVRDYLYHQYDRRGARASGGAPVRAAEYFALVHDALQAGDRVTASRLLGLLTHYYTDAADPLHTDRGKGERGAHVWFERSVMRLLNKRHGLGRQMGTSDVRAMSDAERQAYLVTVGDDVEAYTTSAARMAHRDYRHLMRKLRRRHFSRPVMRLTVATLQRSVRGVADLIAAAECDAVQTYSPAMEAMATPVLVSQDRVVTASSQDALYHAARFGNDGDLHSSWMAADVGYPQWWQVDLGAGFDLESVKLEWPKAKTRSYRYTIQVSDDGAVWSTAADRSARATVGVTTDSVAGAGGRYVRVTVLGYGVSGKAGRSDAANSAPAAILEASVFGTRRTAPTPTPTPSASETVTPTPTPTAIPTATPVSTPTPTLSGSTISVPSGATQTQIDSAVARAVSAGKGTWLQFPSGSFTYSGTFTVPDGINVRGQGIWRQAAADGGGGTWLACTKGMRWGSDSTIQDLLVGANTTGVTCQFRPIGRGVSTAGPDTQSNGSHNVTFNFVRFKGGSDAGASLVDLGGNFSSLWSDSLKTMDMVNTTWNDCEFERPQSTNSVNGTSLGAILNLWWDSRSGGAELHDLAWNRCHFGVANGYQAGIDGFGCGRTIIVQPGPAEHAADGPRPNSGGVGDGTNGWLPGFDWAKVTHTAYDISFTDCLMEYALWYPMNVCDYARSYSVWKGNEAGLPGTLTTALTASQNVATGWGNPPQSQWTSMPDAGWIDNVDLTRCYFKGSYPTAHSVVFEISRNATVLQSYTGTGSIMVHAGSYGNTLTGSFSNANRPRTTLFTSDWSGSQTSYTSSPYDP